MRRTLTDRERQTLTALDQQVRDVMAQRRAGTLSDDAFLTEMQRINSEKAIILMTKTDIKRKSRGDLE